MKRIFFFLLLMVTSLIFISCGDKLSSINPGLYEINFNQKYEGQAITIMQRVRYQPDGTYEAINFENNKAVDELKGKFKVEKDKLLFYDNQQHLFIPNGKWTQKEQSTMEIRRINKGSYQYYLKYPDAQTSEKYKKIDLSEGWKTYKRISN
jgi:hypothetical protein